MIELATVTQTDPLQVRRWTDSTSVPVQLKPAGMGFVVNDTVVVATVSKKLVVLQKVS